MRRPALAAAALAVVLATAGCGATDPGITASASTALQGEVLQVARLASAHRYAAARTAVATLEADLRRSVAAGSVSEARAARIRGVVALVATDLRSAAGTPTPTPTSTRTSTPPPTPTPTPTPVQASTPRPAVKATKAPAPVKRPAVHDGKGKWKKGKGGRDKDH